MATAELRAKITADASQFVSEVARTKSAMTSIPKGNILGNAGKDLDQAAIAGKRFAESFAASRQQALGLQAAMAQIAPYLTGAAIVGAVRSTMAFADAISDGAARIGVSTTEYQRWQVAAATSGTTIEKVETQVQRLSTILGGDITAKQEAAFTRLGLSFQQLKNMEPAEAFNAVATALSNLTDPYARAAAAGELFGKKAAAGVAQFAEGLKEARTSIKNLVTEEDIAKVAKLQDAWDGLVLTLKRFAVNRLASVQAYGEELGNLSMNRSWTGAAQEEIAARFGGAVKRSTTPNLDRAEKAAATIPQETAKAAEKRLQAEIASYDIIEKSLQAVDDYNAKAFAEEEKRAQQLADLKEDRERTLQEIKRKGQEDEARKALDNAHAQADMARAAFDRYAQANRRLGAGMVDAEGRPTTALEQNEWNRANRGRIKADRRLQEKVSLIEQGERVSLTERERKRLAEVQHGYDLRQDHANFRALLAGKAESSLAALNPNLTTLNQRVADLTSKIDKLTTGRAGEN